MDSKEYYRLFSRQLIKNQSSLQVNLGCTCIKTNERKHFSKKLIDISGGGLSFKSNLTDDIFLPGTFLNKIEIISREGALLQTSGKVRHIYCDHVKASSPFYKVGVEFKVEFADNEEQFKRDLRKQREKIVNPSLILDNLKSIVENRIPVSLKNIERPTHLTVIGYFTHLKNSAKFYTLLFEPVNQELRDQLFEELDRVQVMYQFNADGCQFTSVIISQAQNKIVLKLPKSISWLWQRSTLRYTPPLDNPLKLKIVHPMLNGKPLERRVIDLTPSGFSIAIECPHDLFIKGMFIPQIALVIPGESQISASAKVKYISMVLDAQMKNYFKCGFSFVNLSVDKTNFLVSYLLSKCYPHLKDAQGEIKFQFMEIPMIESI